MYRGEKNIYDCMGAGGVSLLFTVRFHGDQWVGMGYGKSVVLTDGWRYENSISVRFFLFLMF